MAHEFADDIQACAETSKRPRGDGRRKDEEDQRHPHAARTRRSVAPVPLRPRKERKGVSAW